MSRGPVGIRREDVDDTADENHCAICLEDEVLTDVPIIGETETVGICDDCLTLYGVELEDAAGEADEPDGDDDR